MQARWNRKRPMAAIAQASRHCGPTHAALGAMLPYYGTGVARQANEGHPSTALLSATVGKDVAYLPAGL